jgi:hypothetical protein
MMNQLFPSWMLIVYSIIWVLIAALMLVSLWRLFVKMGQPGWKGIVPFYNLWTAIKVLKKPVRWFWWLTGTYLLCLLTSATISVLLLTALAAGYSSGTILSVMILTILCIAAAIVGLVYEILLIRAWARSFGYGVGFTWGLILLPVVFLPILAFGESVFTEP